MGNVLAASPSTTDSTVKLYPSPPPTAPPPSLDKPSEAPKEGTPEEELFHQPLSIWMQNRDHERNEYSLLDFPYFDA
eukprot:m.139027 g.139027  ORF g.139027 m.139027 type:complete len:77 (+) comp38262_c0_seq30:52-282(+)